MTTIKQARNDLASFLAQAREKCGLSQEEAAEKIGISRTQIARWEIGTSKPDYKRHRFIALVYGIKVSQIRSFYEEEPVTGISPGEEVSLILASMSDERKRLAIPILRALASA